MQKMKSKDQAILEIFYLKESSNLIGRLAKTQGPDY